MAAHKDVEPRIAFLSSVGRAAIQVGGALAKLRHTHLTLKTDMTVEARETAIAQTMKGVFATYEAVYRKKLFDAGVMEASEM